MLFCFVLETISLNDPIVLYLVNTDCILFVLSSDWLRSKRCLARKMQHTYVSLLQKQGRLSPYVNIVISIYHSSSKRDNKVRVELKYTLQCKWEV